MVKSPKLTDLPPINTGLDGGIEGLEARPRAHHWNSPSFLFIDRPPQRKPGRGGADIDAPVVCVCSLLHSIQLDVSFLLLLWHAGPSCSAPETALPYYGSQAFVR